MNGIGVVWVFALMFLICADIIGRTLFDSPLQAVPEIVAFSLIACVFLQLAFGSLDYLSGQIIRKAWMVLLALPVIWWIRQRDEKLGCSPV